LTAMNVLLLSMPDSFEHTPPVAVRMPNGALASLAGNLDAHHRMSIADLILARSQVTASMCISIVCSSRRCKPPANDSNISHAALAHLY